jgi:hypothetical protein
LFEDPVAEEIGGEGAGGSAVEFFKILQSLCADDGQLLMTETIDEMFTLQPSGDSRKSYDAHVDFLAYNQVFTSHKPGTKIWLGLTGIAPKQDIETGLKSGAMSWAGLPNLLWTINRQNCLSIMYAGHVVPFGAMKSH